MKKSISIAVCMCTLAACLSTHVSAAPVTVSFTANVTTATNSFSGAGPTVSGSFTYDTIQGSDSNVAADIGFYLFSGSPYGFSVQVDNFGTLSGTTTLVQVGDNGGVLPGTDTVQFAGNDGSFQASLDWSGPISTFSGDDIPSIAVTSGMSPFLVIREFGVIDLQAVVTSTSFNVVPIPAAVWLFGSGLFGLIGLARRNAA